MNTLSEPVAEAEAAVNAYKHQLLVLVMGDILRHGLKKTYVSPSDISEDIVPPEHRQGVASNAWNALYKLALIARLPMTFTNPALQIFGGRMVCVYTIPSRDLAYAWARANHVDLDHDPKPPVQTELIAV